MRIEIKVLGVRPIDEDYTKIFLALLAAMKKLEDECKNINGEPVRFDVKVFDY